jgi:branched-chain amino acid aminotransferase
VWVLEYDASACVWWNGELLPWDKARPHFLAKGLQYAVSVFEGVRAYSGPAGSAAFRLEDHTKRLLRSAGLIGISPAYSEQELIAAQLQVASENGLSECYFRPTIFLGEGAPGLASAADVLVGIAAWEWPVRNFADRAVRAKVSSLARTFPHRSLSQAKASINYLTGHVALREARAAGYDDAILLDDRGFVSEATTSNMFMVFGDEIVTPSLRSALDGITRDTVIQLLKETGVSVAARDVGVDEMLSADEIFLTGTASEITPLSAIENVALPGTDGPYAQFAQTAYRRAACGTAYQDFQWRTPYHAGIVAEHHLS